MTQEKDKRYDDALERAKKLYRQGTITESLCFVFPELKESEDERIRKAIIEYFNLQDDNTTYSFIPKKDILAWLERQKPVDEEELKKGALKYVARQFMKWLDAKIPNDKMCLSNMECKDIEDAFLKDDWARISHYMRKKLEKQNKTLDPDKVIAWLNNQACLGFIEDIEVEKFVEQFKKDFGL